VLILNELRRARIVQIVSRSSRGDSVCFDRCGQMRQKEKREPSSRALGRVFSKLNCTKGVTKVKENLRSRSQQLLEDAGEIQSACEHVRQSLRVDPSYPEYPQNWTKELFDALTASGRSSKYSGNHLSGDCGLLSLDDLIDHV